MALEEFSVSKRKQIYPIRIPPHQKLVSVYVSRPFQETSLKTWSVFSFFPECFNITNSLPPGLYLSFYILIIFVFTLVLLSLSKYPTH